MTQVSREDVLSLARLSSLQLDDGEVAGLQEDISNILSYIEQLGALDTKGIAPTYQVTGLENVWREDAVGNSIGTDALLSLAPETKNNQVKVPKVL